MSVFMIGRAAIDLIFPFQAYGCMSIILQGCSSLVSILMIRQVWRNILGIKSVLKR